MRAGPENESGRPALKRGGGPARPHGVIRFQHRRKINCGSYSEHTCAHSELEDSQVLFGPPSQALTSYFPGFLWCRRIGMLPTDHLFRKGVATMRNSQPRIASKLELSPCAVSVLGQLFVEGPTSDDSDEPAVEVVHPPSEGLDSSSAAATSAVTFSSFDINAQHYSGGQSLYAASIARQL